MKYTDYEYLWPPRPTNAIPASMLGFYEKRGWQAQYKKNGTCNLLFVNPGERKVFAMTRHKTEHKAWHPNDESNKPFLDIKCFGWFVFVTELLHSKVPGIKNTHYINDILVSNGEYLVGTTFEERQVELFATFSGIPLGEDYSHYIITPNVWLAKNFTNGFKKRWDEVNEKAGAVDGAYIDEGLVLKNPKAKLSLCNKEGTNSSWQAKCRVTTKNYGF